MGNICHAQSPQLIYAVSIDETGQLLFQFPGGISFTQEEVCIDGEIATMILHVGGLAPT